MSALNHTKAQRALIAKDIRRADSLADRSATRIANNARRVDRPPTAKQRAELDRLARELGQAPTATSTRRGAGLAIGSLQAKLDARERRRSRTAA